MRLSRFPCEPASRLLLVSSFFLSFLLSLSLFSFLFFFFQLLNGCSPCIQVRRLISRPGSYSFSTRLVARCYRLFPRCCAYLSTSVQHGQRRRLFTVTTRGILKIPLALPLDLIYSVLQVLREGRSFDLYGGSVR